MESEHSFHYYVHTIHKSRFTNINQIKYKGMSFSWLQTPSDSLI